MSTPKIKTAPARSGTEAISKVRSRPESKRCHSFISYNSELRLILINCWRCFTYDLIAPNLGNDNITIQLEK
jgi:hypothetical protein